MTEGPHSRNLRLHRLSDSPATFFVTKSLRPKKPLLHAEFRQLIVYAFAYAIACERIYLRAFVVMPDHWHALLALREPWTLPRFMHSLMSHVAAKTCTGLCSGGSAWQDTYYETRVRTSRQFSICGLLHRTESSKGGASRRSCRLAGVERGETRSGDRSLTVAV